MWKRIAIEKGVRYTISNDSAGHMTTEQSDIFSVLWQFNYVQIFSFINDLERKGQFNIDICSFYFRLLFLNMFFKDSIKKLTKLSIEYNIWWNT